MMFKKWTAAAMATLLLLPYTAISPPQVAAAGDNAAIIRDGSTYLLDFNSGTLQSGTYHDGNSNAFKFSGDTGNVTLNNGQMVIGPLNGSTVGVFDYGFAGNPTNKFEDFELSFDMTMTHRDASKQAGIQFQKNAWNDGWDAQFKTHVTYDGKMNFFEGAASITNIDGGKYRSIKDYGAPGLNRDVMPWETFRVKQVVDGHSVRTYVNGSMTPIVDVLRGSRVGAGFVGVFGNGNVGFQMDNFLFNRLKPENERDDVGLAGDTSGFYIYIPNLNESVTSYNIRYRNLTDNTSEQTINYTGPRDKYVLIDSLMANKDYKVELFPVYRSDRTQIDTEMTMYRSKTVHVGQPLQTQLTISNGESFFGGSKQIDISVIGADQVRYTLDGSEPTLTHGQLLSGDFIFGNSIVINGTTTLKAAAILNGEIKVQREETYVAGVNPVNLTNSTSFHESQPVVVQSVYADSILYTTDGTDPYYSAVTNTALNGTIVHTASVSLSVTQTTYLKAMAVRGGLAGGIVSAKYTKVPLLNTLVTDWDFTSEAVVFAQEQDELYGKTASPWSNLLGWDVNSDKGVWANHIDTDNVYRDAEGVHLFTTSEPIEASTSNPNFYLDLHDAGLPNIPAEYRYLSIWMKVNHTANAAIYFGTDAGADTNKLSESRKVAIRNTAAEVPEFQRYIIDMGKHAGWAGNITKLRVDPMATYPSMKDGIEIIVKEISLLRKQDLPAEVRLTQFETSPREIVSPGDSFQIKAVLENIGASTTDLSLHLDAPDFLEITPVEGLSVTQLASGQSMTLTYNAVVQETGAGAITFTVKGNGMPTTRGLSRIFSVNASLPASGQPDDVIIGNGGQRLVFPAPTRTGLDGYGFAWVEAMRGGVWSRIAVMPSLGSVQEFVGQDQLVVKELYAAAPSSQAPSDFLVAFEAPDGAEWSGTVRVTDSGNSNLELAHSLQADTARSLAAIAGPTMLLGEAGIPALDPQHKVIRSVTELEGDYVNEALFPGLEWLDAMEKNNRSSDTDAFIGTVDAYRYVPHPRKITVPLMALRKGDLLFGLMWDARQQWDGENDQPSAFFGLPNRLERGNGTVSTKLSLFIPSIMNGINENATFATGIPAFYDTAAASANNENPVRQPYMLAAEQELTLKSQLFVKQSTEIATAVQEWMDEYGLPEPLDYAHGTMQQESEAILTSFENLWSPADSKWMNRIGPVGTPMITSAFVMPYAVLGKYGKYEEIAAQRIATAKAEIGTNYSTYGYILPYYLEGIAARTMESFQSANVDSLIAAAKLVNPASVTEGVYWDYQTYITRKGFPTSSYMGQLSDVTAGSNAEFLFKMLRHARMTGNASATTYGLAGLDYVNESFTMPRGSQSWELRNMIPELETAALIVRANVEAYAMTGSISYLDSAKLWAARGLPFIYLWDDGSYGVDKANGLGGSFGSHTFMRYAAIAAFGQSIYRADGKPLPSTWLGRPVQWSGHDYGIALMELYQVMEGAGLWTDYLQDGGLDYRRISEGLSVSGSRQTTAADNRYPTHLYDAASLLKWETSDYLYPNYQGAELLGLLLGERTNPVTRRVAVGGKEVRISAPAVIEVLNAQTDQLSLRLGFSNAGEYTVFLQGVAAIGQAQLGPGSSAGAEITSFAVRSGSGFAEVHLKVTEEGASQADITLSALEAIGSPAAPTMITMHPGHATVDAGSNTSLSVTASNATMYQWQVNTGEGFVNVSNAAPYSGAKSATLTLTGVTADMNGYAYRVVASGSVLPAVVSDSAILTVNILPGTSITPKDEDSPTAAPTTTSSAPITNPGVGVLVNGKVERAGTTTTAIVNNQSVTTIVLDQKKLEERIEAEGQHAVITILVNTNSDVVVGELDGQMIRSMAQKQAILEIKMEKATYTLPAQQIDIDWISDQLGKSVMLQDIKIQIEIAVPTLETMKIVENAAVKGEFTIMAPPLNFAVKAMYRDTRLDVSMFNTYVERTIALTDGVNPDKMTTGVVIEPDGTVRHAPTKIVHLDGKYYAKVKSLTNSTYLIVGHPIEFEDIAHHWAQDAVNDMGSRMVISGVGDDLFIPDQDITRAEFAAIIVRGLGLKLESGAIPFADVMDSNWYSSVVQTAYSYDLINGFEDGTFLPMDKITREQAMVIIAKAMKITDLRAKLIPDLTGEWLSPFADMNDASEWAKTAIADCLQAGIVTGRNDSQLIPKAYITRAEVAIMIQRLLRKSGLI